MAIVASIFGNLASQQNLQALLDNSQDVLFGQSVWRQYLDWGLPQIELTFDTVIGRSRIEAAASIVDPDSPAPLRSRGKLELLEGKIPTMKESFKLNQKDYRALRMLEALPISDAEKKNQLIKKLYDDVTNAATSTDRRLDMMFWQGISNFKIDINLTNNPDGVAFGEVDLLAAEDQSRTVAVVWSDAAADPFKDINEVVNYAAAKGRKFAEIWIESETWLNIKNLDKVKSAISGYLNPGSNKNFVVTLNMVNEYLSANQLPVLKIVNVRSMVEKDGKPQILNPFKKENVVFVPAGKLGLVHNALTVEEMEPVEGITYAKYDRTLVKKYRDNSPWTEFTEVELNAFPALEAIDGIYLLKTDVATA
ncbi:hypothetical protein EGT74_24515 [Chitinophaga lutea]|uniref:Major capsid protein E n=1 Tax=Chitinophaga lutea TaxID=2488634 RepID=A0A3N4PP91_9BACT|nr:major capsid protein [Chitinophaga lutea]RPE05550.1 hypothetical protein EGT74_24515 [Chitinophaga lutea]